MISLTSKFNRRLVFLASHVISISFNLKHFRLQHEIFQTHINRSGCFQSNRFFLIVRNHTHLEERNLLDDHTTTLIVTNSYKFCLLQLKTYRIKQLRPHMAYLTAGWEQLKCQLWRISTKVTHMQKHSLATRVWE